MSPVARTLRSSAPRGELHGVVVCLTGMPAERKDRLHSLVTQMGGSFTRDLNVNETTHLVAVEDSGEKYAAAVATEGTICIVKPSWIEDCWKQQQLVDCKIHALAHTVIATSLVGPKGASSPLASYGAPSTLRAEQALDGLLAADHVTRRQNDWLFSSCHVLLVGFDEPCLDENNVATRNDGGIHMADKLRRLLRRCLATIHWEMNDSNVLTHVILPDQCMDEATRAILIRRVQDYGLALVSPRWVIDSCRRHELLPCTPLYWPDVVLQSPLQDVKPDTKGRKRPRNLPPDRTSQGLFRGSVFCLLRVAPPTGCVDFKSHKLESLITTHGGQILSNVVLDALHADAKTKPRTCYVVCWGGGTSVSWDQHQEWHPLLCQVQKRQLCNIVPTTPIWVQTCVTEQACVAPKRYPELFAPTHHPLHLFSTTTPSPMGPRDKETNERSTNDSASTTTKPIRLSLTGFVGSHRAALIHLIHAMGGMYDDAMHKDITTHLLVDSTNDDSTSITRGGPKYIKALEWKLRIVTLDWLYHGVRHGFDNE